MEFADAKRIKFIVWGIIVALCSLLWGMMSTPIKQSFFMPKDAFFFGSDGVSIILAGVSLVLLGISLVIVGLGIPNKKMKWGLFSGVLATAVFLFLVTFDEYYYYSPNGIYTNDMITAGTEHTDWEEIALITSIYLKDETGTTLPRELIFEKHNGETLVMSLKGQLSKARNQIDGTVLSIGGDSVLRIIDKEGNVIQESFVEGKK